MAVAAACATLLVAAGLAAAATATPDHVGTVAVTIHFSQFDLASLQVAPGETVRFVVTNADPIDHEFLVGDAKMQWVHEKGTEAAHGARPGEISVPAGTTVETMFTFPLAPAPGWEFACHLPGHYDFGMHGPISLS
ncbi:MAG: plastocyanin/azurin family copper-binding protein [Actinomycetota bacterium]